MLKIKVYSIGKTKETWLQEALSEYEKRLKTVLAFEWVLTKDDTQLKQSLSKEKRYICLDPTGKQYSSEEFAGFIAKAFSDCNSRICFVIGGAEGIPSVIKLQSMSLISLSRMTFTHQITRLVLIEQIYRAFEIKKGSAYHK